MSFNANKFKEQFKRFRKKRKKCCGMQCLAKMNEVELKVHIRTMEHIFSIETPTLRNQSLRLFAMTCYMMQINDQGNHCEFRLPSFKSKICRDVWCLLLCISVSTYKAWRQVTVPERDVMPPVHGLIGQSSNAAKPEARASVVSFVKRIADYDGHPLPVRIRAADKRLMERIDGTEQMVVLPPRYTKRDLYRQYLKLHPPDDPLYSSHGAFQYTLNQEVPWVRVSMRERGLCDLCFAYRDSVRTISEANLDEKAQEWKRHLIMAEKSTQIYRDCKERARQNWETHMCNPSSETLHYGMISFDAAAQFNIPMVEDQTHNEYHAEKFGVDIRVLGINNQGAGQGGHQHNYLYAEPLKHDSNGIISALHHYLSVTQPILGKARTLVVQCDSTTGSNKNQFMLAYWVARVAQGMHDKVVWQFMTVGHTKFDVDRFFGKLRHHLGERSTVLTPTEFAASCDASAIGNFGVVMPTGWLRDYKKLGAYTKPFKDMRKRFPYEICIEAVNTAGHTRRVHVSSKREPNGASEPAVQFLKDPDFQIPSLEDNGEFPPNAPTMGSERLHHIANGTFWTLVKTRTLTFEQRNWWQSLLGEFWHSGFERPMTKWGWNELKRIRKSNPNAAAREEFYFGKGSAHCNGAAGSSTEGTAMGQPESAATGGPSTANRRTPLGIIEDEPR